jgi:hypothetical protein
VTISFNPVPVFWHLSPALVSSLSPQDYYISGAKSDEVDSVECTSCLSVFTVTEYGGGTRPNTLGTAVECAATTDNVTHGATSLESVRLTPGHWRLGPRSKEVHECITNNGFSPCIGGTDSGEETSFDDSANYTGSGYCAPGHTGPLCEVHTSLHSSSSHASYLELACASPTYSDLHWRRLFESFRRVRRGLL